MRINNLAVREAMARRLNNISDLAKLYGCTNQRMRVILNSINLTEVTVGKLAKALDVDVSEIIER